MTPHDSGKAVARAHMWGLRALVDLLRNRTIKETQHLYPEAHNRLSSAIKKWKISLGRRVPDFAVIADLEKKLRDIELENIWETTARYGNTERRRFRNEREGPVGPLNKLINILGSKLRDYFLLMNPLSSPVQIGRQKSKTIWGYSSREFGRVPVAHGADLAELDLADMLRSHGRELCRKAFISGVHSDVFDNYALLLIRRFSPFVDYVYTDGRIGEKEFLRPKVSTTKRSQLGTSADEVLRGLVDEIDALHARRTSQRVFPSGVRKEEDSPPTSEFFQDQIRRLHAESRGASKEEAKALLVWARFLKKLTKKKKPKLKNQDAEHLYNQARNKARWEGDRCHTLATSGLPQPYRQESVILEGARFIQSEEDFLITGETRLRTAEGPGRADVVVYVSAKVPYPNRPGQLNIMKPVAVFEIKTRTGFNWEIRAQESKGKRKKTVPKLIVRKRGLTDDEWDDAVSETPAKSDIDQLKLYESGIIKEYEKLTGDNLLGSLLKGVIVLDTQFDSALNRQIVISLLKCLRDDVVANKVTKRCDRLLVRYRESIAKRAALMLLAPSESQFAALQVTDHTIETTPVYKPFSESNDTSFKHILYLSARAASNSGFTASWIAKYWHGMQYAQQLSRENDNVPVVWLDLAGVFNDPELTKTRLRVNTQDEGVNHFFDDITFIDLSSAIDGFLFQGKNLPDVESILLENGETTKQYLVVVSGWNWVEDSLPPRLKPVLAELERYMVQELVRRGGMTLWFLDPRPDEMTSVKYRNRCLLPFWDDSPHQPHITELVWNLPVKPYSSTQTAPMLDDLRVIIHQKKDTIDFALIEVPPLKNWSSRFWSKRSKRKSKEKSVSSKGRTGYSARDMITSKILSKELINDSIDLIPWLRTLHPEEFKVEKAKARLNLSIQAIPLYGEPSHPKGVMSRVRYQARQKGARGRRSHVSTSALIPKQAITHPRHYRRWRKRKKSTANIQIYGAPREEHLEFRQFREQTACNVEIRRVRQTLIMLSKQQDSWTSDHFWQDFLSRHQRLLPKTDETVELEHLNKISDLLMADDMSSGLWNSLLWIRERRLGHGLRTSEEEKLEALLEGRPGAATLFGNYLFLLLLALKKRHPDLRIDQMQTLWEIVKSWHLRQIGFIIRDLPGEQSRYKFDVRAVWSNLCKRSRVLTGMPLPVQSAVRLGQFLVVPHDHYFDYWVFIEDEHDRSRLCTGLWIGQNPFESATSMRWCESNAREIADRASDAKPEVVHDLLVGKVDGIEYVWYFAENEWNLLGELTVIPRKQSALTRIRGLQVKLPTSTETPEIPAGVLVSPNLHQRVKQELSEIAQMRHHIASVRCELGLDSEMYTVSFESDGEQLDTRTVSRTSDLLSLLRRPLTDGVPLQSSKSPDLYLTWNPYQDINYGELQLIRPYIERKSPYVHVRVPLPLTSGELVERPSLQASVTLCHDERECPIVSGKSQKHGACWKLKLEEDSHASDIMVLLGRPLSDQDLSSLLTAGEVFLEGARYSLDLQFEQDPKERAGAVFRESRKIAHALGLKPVHQGAFLNLDSERLQFRPVTDGTAIRVFVYSDMTGERVRETVLFPHEGKWDVDMVLDGFKQETIEFVNGYFGGIDNPEDRIIDFDELVETMRGKLKEMLRRRRHRR